MPQIILKSIVLSSILLLFCSCDNRNQIYMKMDSGLHITGNTDISINGLKVGQVESIELLPSRQVLATLRIDRKINIPIDATIFIKTIDFLGNHNLCIEGGVSTTYLSSGDTIKYSGVTSISSGSSAIDEISNLINDLFGNNQKDSILRELRLLNAKLDSISIQKQNQLYK